MKKVKVMLAGIAVLAVIGGAFAFKAKSAFGTTLYTTVGSVAPAAGACTVQRSNATTTTTPQTGQASVYYTVDAPGDCSTPNRVFTISNN